MIQLLLLCYSAEVVVLRRNDGVEVEDIRKVEVCVCFVKEVFGF